MAVKEIELKNLVENDYNPRQTFSDAKMVDLKDSIDKMGLIEPLAVRELDGTYEVIAGTRRFKALKDLRDGDYKVQCNVLDVNKEEAKLVALSENLEREDFTSTEEAKAFAEYVDVTIPESEAEKLEDLELKETEREGYYRVNFKEYIGYLKEGVATELCATLKIQVPHHDSQTVQQASDMIPGVTPRQIRDRITLLVLPEELFSAIDEEELTQEAAQIIARLRSLKSPEARQKEMKKLAEEWIDDDRMDIKELKKRVEAKKQDYEAEEEQKEQLVEERLKTVASRKEELGKKLSEVVQSIKEDEEMEMPNINNNILKNVDEVISVLRERVSDYSGDKLDETNEKIRELEESVNKLQETKNNLRVRGSSTVCPYCESNTKKKSIESKIEEKKSKIEGLKETRDDFHKKKGDLQDMKNSLQEERKSYVNGLKTLQDAYEEYDVSGELEEKVKKSHVIEDVERAEEILRGNQLVRG